MPVVPALLHATAEADGKHAVGARLEPHLAARQPDIRQFDLKAVNNLLLEEPVLVEYRKSAGGIFERGKRIHKAGGKSAESAVTEPGVRLAVVKILKVKPHFAERLGICVNKTEV